MNLICWAGRCQADIPFCSREAQQGSLVLVTLVMVFLSFLDKLILVVLESMIVPFGPLHNAVIDHIEPLVVSSAAPNGNDVM